MPQRFNEIGLAGRAPGNGVQAGIDGSPGRQRDPGTLSDPFLRQFVIDLPNNAIATEQATGFVMPDHCTVIGGFVRTKTIGGTAVDVGIVTDPDLLTVTVPIPTIAEGEIPLLAADFSAQIAILSGLEIAYIYTAGAAGEAELVLVVLASDD